MHSCWQVCPYLGHWYPHESLMQCPSLNRPSLSPHICSACNQCLCPFAMYILTLASFILTLKQNFKCSMPLLQFIIVFHLKLQWTKVYGENTLYSLMSFLEAQEKPLLPNLQYIFLWLPSGQWQCQWPVVIPVRPLLPMQK